MQIAEFFQRFGANGDGYRQTAADRCHGRVVCVDCPRDNHAPPLLPLRLSVHVRLHRERFTNHAIRFWCWTHYEFHPESEDPLTQEETAGAVGLGACNRDNNVWLVNAGREKCLLCGREPDFYIPLEAPGAPSAAAAVADTPEPADYIQAAPVPVRCPACDAALVADITPDNILLRLAGGVAATVDLAGGAVPPSPSAVTPAGEPHTASMAEPMPAALAADSPADAAPTPQETAPA